MTKAIYIIGTVVSVLLSLLLGGEIVSAASPYDSIVHPTEELVIRSSDGVHERDITTLLLQTMQQSCDSTYYDSFINTLSDSDGKVAVIQTGWWGQSQDVRVLWTDNASAQMQFSPDSGHHQVGTNQLQKFVSIMMQGNGNIDCAEVSTSYHAIAHSCTPPSCHPSFKVYSSSFPVTYPSGYEGELIPGAVDRDLDQDGISDAIESPNYPNRDDVFCGVSQCAYPDPAKKDIYLELDWMKNGATTYKPTQTQLDLVKDMFADKNINLHIDTGQYGGGNELATYTANLPNTDRENEVDAGDYKLGGDGISANFSADRELIWRYMISGNKYINGDDTTPSLSSGWAEVLGDQSFIAMGALNDVSGASSFDRMIANTVAHELGHNLCLSSTQHYIQQPSECVYGGIDNDDVNDLLYNLLNYESVMNYRYQLTDVDDIGVVDYSDNTHGTGDHNDWAGVELGIKGFSGVRTEINAQRGGTGYLRSPDGTIIAE